MKNYHVTKAGDGPWTLKVEGGSRALATGETKVEAVQQMREYMHSHEGSVKIHKVTGEIQEERTYPRSIDPKDSKG